MNIMNYMLYGNSLPIPTNSDSVELFTFIFFLDAFLCNITYPIDIAPPLCTITLLGTEYTAYIHVYITDSVFALILLLSFIVFFTYVRPHFNFFQFSTLLLVTLIVRKDTNVSRSGHFRFTICKSFAVTL